MRQPNMKYVPTADTTLASMPTLTEECDRAKAAFELGKLPFVPQEDDGVDYVTEHNLLPEAIYDKPIV